MSAGEFVILGASHWHAPWHRRSLEEAGQRAIGASDQWQEALDAHPHAVPVVLTPPAETPPVLARIVAERRPFVLEKPGTVNAAALAPIVQAVEEFGIPTLVPFVNRLSDFWREVDRTELRQNWTHAHFRIIAGPPDRYRRDGVPWVLDPEIYGGGALRNLGVHATDAVAELLGATPGADDVVVRSAQVSHATHHLAVEDFALATLETSDGRTLTLEAGYTMPAENAADKEWRLQGPGASVAEANGLVTVRDATGARTFSAAPSAAQYLAFGHTMAALAEGGALEFAGVRELLAAQNLIDRIYDHANHEQRS